MEVIFILISVFVYSKGSDKILPRGVSLAQRLLYEPNREFTCLDGSKRIPYLYVNDDYCDCNDGSDEPGTSACPNGLFHCHNLGFVPLDLPTSRVNDGVCDCCDASDEYLYDNCTDICDILGAEAKKAAEQEAEIAAQGNELRLQMISAGKEIRQNKQERLSALEAEKLEAVRLKEEANRLKETAEAAEFAAKEAHRVRQEELKLLAENLEKTRLENEAKQIFQQMDSNDDEILQPEEFKMNDVFDQNNDGQITIEDLEQFFATTGAIDWPTFLKSWPKLRVTIPDEKDSPKSSDHYSNNDNYVNEPGNRNEEDTSKSNPSDYKKENVGDSKEWDVKAERNNEEHVDNEYIEDDNIDKMEELDDDKDETGNDDEEEGEGVEGEVETEEERVDRSVIEDNNYDEETVKLIEDANAARSRFESAERSLQDVERELTRIKESLSKDYGPEDEYIALEGQCFSYSDREYTYKLCPFDQVVQMGKSGGSETRLGVWSGWQDESHKVMIYDKGQACWNGPQRSTKVSVICGLENAVIGAAEPNKCEYELILQTAAACKVAKVSQTVHRHDEF